LADDIANNANGDGNVDGGEGSKSFGGGKNLLNYLQLSFKPD